MVEDLGGEAGDVFDSVFGLETEHQLLEAADLTDQTVESALCHERIDSAECDVSDFQYIVAQSAM